MSDSWYPDDENLPSPSAVRGRGSPSGRFFIPISGSTPKIGPSRAITAQPSTSPLPGSALASMAATRGATPSGQEDWLGKGLELWNKSVESGDRIKERQRLEDALLNYRNMAAPPSQPPTPAGEAQPQAAMPITDAPAPGSYEARNRQWESSGSDTIANKDTGAAGRYQFMPSTAEGIRKQHPELGISDNWRTNPEDQEKLMKVYTDTSRGLLKQTLGRDPTGGELYALHLFGHGKGPSVVQGGNKRLSELTSAEERRVNPFLNKFETANDLLKFFNRKFG